MVVLVGLLLMLALPAVTTPPVGSAWTVTQNDISSEIVSAFRVVARYQVLWFTAGRWIQFILLLSIILKSS
ncbi:hypothetical protein GCM10027278_39450 [Paralcaligenes ginsengisoli]